MECSDTQTQGAMGDRERQRGNKSIRGIDAVSEHISYRNGREISRSIGQHFIIHCRTETICRISELEFIAKLTEQNVYYLIYYILSQFLEYQCLKHWIVDRVPAESMRHDHESDSVIIDPLLIQI